MKAFEILDSENSLFIGTLLYYEREQSFIIELDDSLDEWTAPFLFTSFVKNGVFTIPREISLLWVRERIIPSNRQNIADILRNHKLKEYDEMKLLELSHGKCAQDHLYIRKIEQLPEYVSDRMKTNLSDCAVLNDYSLLCFFKDDTIKKVSLFDLQYEEDTVNRLTKHKALFESGKITAGGYAVTFRYSHTAQKRRSDFIYSA